MEMILSNGIVVWLLIFTRFTTTIMFIPIFGERDTPFRFRLSFAAMLALIFYSTAPSTAAFAYSNFAALASAIIFEVINGLTLGFVVAVMMNTLYIAGHMIDMNMGFGMAKVISPTGTPSVPLTANFYYMLTAVLFVISNAHHLVILGFARTLQLVPLGSLAFSARHVDSYFDIFKETFIIGFQLAMPIVMTILIANIILGLLSKAMPGMNVFMVGMPFKIIIGLATLFVVLPVTVQVIERIIEKTTDYLHMMIQLM